MPPGTVGDLLPGGRSFLLTEGRGLSGDFGHIRLLDLESGDTRTVIEGGYDARFVPPGYLLFARGGNLLAVRFDSETGTVSGEPVTVVRGVSMDSTFAQVQVAVSRSGAVALVPGTDRSVASVGWIDRQGSRGLLPLEPRLYGSLDLTRDDRYLALHVGDVKDYVVVYDLELGQERRLPGSRGDGWPVWSRDGRRIAFTREGEPYRTMVANADGSDPVELLQSDFVDPSVWSADDRYLLVQDWPGQRVGMVPSDGSGPVQWVPDRGRLAHGVAGRSLARPRRHKQRELLDALLPGVGDRGTILPSTRRRVSLVWGLRRDLLFGLRGRGRLDGGAGELRPRAARRHSGAGLRWRVRRHAGTARLPSPPTGSGSTPSCPPHPRSATGSS